MQKLDSAKRIEYSLGGSATRNYWRNFGKHYSAISFPREKAVEHSLTFDLFQLEKVSRYCDVASALSPIQEAFSKKFPKIEFWKQDLLYETDMSRKIVGGFAQDMKDIPTGFFDLMALHCSYEHFSGNSDSLFVKEVNRLLSDRGACLILPLYMDSDPKIFFDPTRVKVSDIAKYDSEAGLRATYNYLQEHGRYYSPQTLEKRVLSHCPENLKATLIRFTDQDAIDPSVYLQFGLVLHRSASVFRFS